MDLHLASPVASSLTCLIAHCRDGAGLGALEAARDAGLEVGGYTEDLESAPAWVKPHLIVRGNSGEAARSAAACARATLLISFGDAAAMIRQVKRAAAAGYVRHLRLGHVGRQLPAGMAELLAEWIESRGIGTLCVIGTSEQREPGIREAARVVMAAVLAARGRVPSTDVKPVVLAQ